MKPVIPLLSLLVVTASAGTLPGLVESPWMAWYAGWDARDFRFGVRGDGAAALVPYKKRGGDISARYWIDIEPVIEELRGERVVTKRPADDGWTARSPAALEPDKVTYRGTVSGGATFEVTFEMDGRTIRGGGRILDKGELTEHPIRFALRIQIPNVYYYQKDEKKLEDLAEGDKIQLLRADGEKLRFDAWEPVWGQEQNGPGITEARIELEGYDGARIDLVSGEAATFEFWNRAKGPLYKGFTLGWKPDPAKDPKGEARFELKFR
jgi:hypothetical protein